MNSELPEVRPLAFESIDSPSPTPLPDPRSPHPTPQPWTPEPAHPPATDEVLFPDLDRGNEDEGAQRERDELLAAELKGARERGWAQGHAEGFEQGRAEGLERGRVAAGEELEAQGEQLRAAVESLTRARQELLGALELDLAEVALGLAAELAGGALELEPERVIELARQGVRLLVEADAITLRAAPATTAPLREAIAELAAGASASSVTVVEDPELAPGGCLVESELGRVDLRVSERLAPARKLLEKVRG